MVQLNKKAYTELILQNLEYLKEHCDENNLEYKHIKQILIDSVKCYFPDDCTDEYYFGYQEEK